MTLFAWAGCGDPTGPDLDELRTAPLEATVEGTSFQLRLIIGKSRQTLPRVVAAHAFLVQPDSLPVPESISVERLWVVNEDRIWEPEEITEREGHSTECPHERQFSAIADGTDVELAEWRFGERAFAVVHLATREENRVLLRSSLSEISDGPLPLNCGGKL